MLSILQDRCVLPCETASAVDGPTLSVNLPPDFSYNTRMAASSPAREFAVDVVRTLRGAGFEALWAGGCVRDQLLGLTPKDYDVATSARPEQIRDLFGRKRTLAIGAA